MLEPGRYDGVPTYKLLEAAAHGYIAVDHRFLHAILDRPDESMADLVRFAAEDRDDPVDLQPQLTDIFQSLRRPEALPFFIRLVRESLEDVDDQIVESIVQLGAAAVDPLLLLLQELESEAAGEVPFVLSALRVRDPRILDALTARLLVDPHDTAFCLETYGDPAAIPALRAALDQAGMNAPARSAIQSAIDALSAEEEPSEITPDEPFNIWELYSEQDLPEFDELSDQDRLAMLESASPDVRTGVALSYRNSEPPLDIRARLLQLAKADPVAGVRGACWEALSEISSEPEIRKAMRAVLDDSHASLEEKGGAAVALAQHSDDGRVFEAILALYQNPKSRAQALKAMARSMDRRFVAYPPQHLDDSDPEIRTEAIWGIGYLNVSSEASRLEAFFDDEQHRTDALFAYALSVPGETSPGRVRALLKKIEQAASGFQTGEEELVCTALDQRLMLHGKKPVFFRAGSEDESASDAPPPATKAERNDPCPCGSGKKFKKCCGA